MNDLRDLARTKQDFSRGLRAREPDDVRSLRVTAAPPSLRRPLTFLFGALVVLPALCVFLYLALFASPQYESTASFVLRGDVERGAAKASGALPSAATITALNRTQEGGMLVRFLNDRAFLDRLGEKLNVASYFEGDTIDPLSRLSPGGSQSSLLAYWESMTDIEVDPLAGTLTLKVRAFAPDDARQIAQATLEVSEEMLNEMLASSRSDALRIAEQDRQRAAEELGVVRGEIEAFRKANGVLDPRTAGTDALTLILERRQERASLAAELQAALASLSPRSVQVRALKARLAALDEQIAALEADLNKTGEDRKAVAALISSFDELELKRAFAEQTFSLSEMTLLRTQAEIERWHVYLIPISPPSTPTVSAYPKPLKQAGHVMLICFIVWGLLSLLALSTADHRQ